MGRFITTNAPASAATCVLGNSTAKVCGSFCGDGRNICNIGNYTPVGCVWQPIDVCCDWSNQITGFKCFLYNFSCWHMIKFEFNGLARCDYDSCVKILMDSTNCDLSANVNSVGGMYTHRYQTYCGFACNIYADILCLPTNCMSLAACTSRTGPWMVCIFPISVGHVCVPYIGGRYKTTGHAGTENSCGQGFFAPFYTNSPGQICYPLKCVPNCSGMNFNRLRISNGCNFFSSCQGPGGGPTAGAYYGLWGIPRQTTGLASSTGY